MEAKKATRTKVSGSSIPLCWSGKKTNEGRKTAVSCSRPLHPLNPVKSTEIGGIHRDGGKLQRPLPENVHCKDAFLIIMLKLHLNCINVVQSCISF